MKHLILCIAFALAVAACSTTDKYPVAGGMLRPDGSTVPPPAWTNEPSIWMEVEP